MEEERVPDLDGWVDGKKEFDCMSMSVNCRLDWLKRRTDPYKAIL